MVGLKLRVSGVKVHNSLGIGERLRELSRPVFKKIKVATPNIPPKYVQVAKKAMTDTIGKNELIPSRLVFGVLPGFSIFTNELLKQKGRMEVIKVVQAEMNLTVSERRV